MSAKFYKLRQCNSGGYIINNNAVSQYVVVEAKDFEEAEELLYKITRDSSFDYCECCGYRWYVDDINGYINLIESIEDYLQPYEEVAYSEDFNICCIVYYISGDKKYLRRKING